MTLTLEQARARLQQHDQSHVLRFWDRLDPIQRDGLLKQIGELDFESIARMRRMLKDPPAPDVSAIRPAPVEQLTPASRAQLRQVGEDALRAGRVGCVLVAGGQGSRLGFEGPKGAYPIGPVSQAPLFFIHARKVLALQRKYKAPVPLYVMTSESNDADTRAFFLEHRHFGLAPEHVRFFVQGMWPALTDDGRIILDRPDHIFMSPDGHGGTLSALLRAGMIDDMERAGVEMLFYFQVDNPLVEVADPVFLGFHASRRADISIKVCAKRDAAEKLGVVVHRGGRCAIVEYTELTPAQMHAVLPNGQLEYRFGSVAIHIFSRAFLRAQAEAALPLHLAHKKVTVCDADGAIVTPAKPNAYKFEKFIFDAIPNTDRAFSLEFAREEEFSPVKNAEGEDSPATTVRDMTRKYARWLESVGVKVPRDAKGEPRYRIEIDPVYALGPEDLQGKLPKDLEITRDLLLA